PPAVHGPDPAPGPPAAGDDPGQPRQETGAAPGPAQPAGLVIEHGHGGTIVTGTSKADRPLHTLLTGQKFRFSQAREFWYLPRPWSFALRDRRVRQLKAGLDRIGRTYTERDNPLAAPAAQPAAALPAADPYPDPQELAAGCGTVLRAYDDLAGTDAGRRLWYGETRPDVAALKAAATALRTFRRHGPAGPDRADPGAALTDLAGYLAACAAAAQALQANLAAQHRRAPRFDPALEQFIAAATQAAARTAATAQTGGFPAAQAPAGPGTATPDPGPAQPDDQAPGPAAEPAAAPDSAGPLPSTPQDGEAMTAIPRVTVLHGHTSPDTAHVTTDYPYGHTLRCTRRSWLDTATTGAKRGQVRLAHQTTDPKTPGEPWNRPHTSTYYTWAVMYLDDQQHLGWHAVGHWGPDGAQDAEIHLDGTYGQLTEDERACYDKLARRGRESGSWESWDNALAWIRGYLAANGTLPAARDVTEAGRTASPAFVLDQRRLEIALAAAAAPAAEASAGPGPAPAGGPPAPGPHPPA
ncbi:MAG: hypothetical protein ACRDRJ_53575, partial [Streptosporangiaceae bacterium]